MNSIRTEQENLVTYTLAVWKKQPISKQRELGISRGADELLLRAVYG